MYDLEDLHLHLKVGFFSMAQKNNEKILDRKKSQETCEDIGIGIAAKRKISASIKRRYDEKFNILDSSCEKNTQSYLLAWLQINI